MAELTRVAPADVSNIAVLGASLKMEVVRLQPASGASVLQGDTFSSRLANPLFGFAFPNGDNTAGAYGLTLTLTANSRVVTVNVTNGSLDANLTITAVVFGR